MKILKWVLLSLIAITVIFYLYLANYELFYPEYWLQKAIINSEQEQSQLRLTESYLSYRFVYNEEIDVMIDLADNGVLQLTYGDQLSTDLVINKELIFQVDPKIFEQLRIKFMENWSHSIMKDADFKFGGTYYILSLKEIDNNPIGINYYNVVPNDTFKKYKDELIKLAYEVLGKE